jgi:hypothetical protein
MAARPVRTPSFLAAGLNRADLASRLLLPWASNQRHQLALHIGVAVDVPLGCQQRPVTGEQLNIPE